MSRLGRDPASWLLAGAARLLPPARGEWGRAMRAELAGIESGQARWRFALGCIRVVASQPAVLPGIGYPLLMAGVLVAVVTWTDTVAYAPLRWALVALVSILVAIAWLGRRAGMLGPVGKGWAARLVRAGGYLLVGVTTLGVVVFMESASNPSEKAGNGVPILAVVLTSYLLGFLTVTAHRSAATGRVLTTGAGLGVAAAAVWLVAVLAAPPIPPSVAAALALIAAAITAAAFANAGRRGSTDYSLLAALCAGTVAALLIVILVAVLANYGPPSLIPDLAPAALTPAADLAQSRIEIEDPYVAVLFLGCLLAAILSITTIVTRAQTSTRLDQPATTPR